MSLEHPDVRRHTWNSGFECGISFACQTLKLEPGAYGKLMEEWSRQTALPLAPAKQKVKIARKKVRTHTHEGYGQGYCGLTQELVRFQQPIKTSLQLYARLRLGPKVK